MQYCSLQHQTLLLSPDTSTTGCCFHFGSASSLLLELFLLPSPVEYWAPNNLGSSSFSVISFCLLILFMQFSGKNAEVVCHSVGHVLSELSTMIHPSWVALHGTAHSFIKLDKAVIHVIRKTLYSQQKQGQELTVAQVMNSLLQNSDLN